MHRRSTEDQMQVNCIPHPKIGIIESKNVEMVKDDNRAWPMDLPSTCNLRDNNNLPAVQGFQKKGN